MKPLNLGDETMKNQLRIGLNRLFLALCIVPGAVIALGIHSMVRMYPHPRWLSGSDDIVIVGIIGLAIVGIARWVVMGFIPED